MSAVRYHETMTDFPLAHLDARKFAALDDTDIALSPQLNVVLGDNGAGKSQLMKLLYSTTFVLQDGRVTGETSIREYETRLAKKLVGVFRPNSLGRLVTRTQGRSRAEVSVRYGNANDALEFSFASNSKTAVKITSRPSMPTVSSQDETDRPVFLPPHELLSIYPGFVSLYDNYKVEFDETWRDTASLLGKKPLRGPREKNASKAIKPLEEVLRGSIFDAGDTFYLQRWGLGNLEAHLLADGERKLAEIVRLVTTGTLLQSGYLFWDEPEASLNPATQRVVAKTIGHLAKTGTQVFIATHSLFLLRELVLELEGKDTEVRYIGLRADKPAQSVSSLDDLDFLAALEAEAAQEERYFSSPVDAL